MLKHKMYLYIHITCLHHYKDIFNTIMDKMKKSGLYDQVEKIRIVLIHETDPDQEWYNDSKIEIIHRAPLGTYESETINRIDVPDDCPVLYLHSKGVTKPHIKQIYDWTEMMLYYLIEEWRLCVEGLNEYDTVGVNLHYKPIQDYSGNYVHYSGNMWWTKGKHLKRIGKLYARNYLDAEMYICKSGKHLGLWNSELNHYFDFYTPDKYRGKVEPYCIKN
jgi:hypothetical protein